MQIGEAWLTRDKNKKKEDKKKVTKKRVDTARIHSPVKTTVEKKKEENRRIHSPVKTERKYTDEFMKDMTDPLPVKKDDKHLAFGKARSDPTSKTKLVPAPHRNIKGEKVRVEDRSVKKRPKKKMVNPARGFRAGGKLGIDNSGQKLVQKLYNPLDPIKPRPNQRLSGKGAGKYKGKAKQFKTT